MVYSLRRKPWLSATTALITLSFAGAAAAQAVGAASGNEGLVAEVVVTAQKRNEALVNVPISITAISGEGLAKTGVTSASDLSTVVPGLHVDSSGAFFQPSIRGVGTAIAGAGASANVATYVDGVYQPQALSTDFNFIDVASVQVLKGPQGTLFGRNSTGGAVLVTTRAPSFTTGLDAQVGYGSFNSWSGALFATGPIIDDKLAASISLGASHSDGWVKNIATGRDGNPSESYLARGKIRFEPTDKLRFNLTLQLFRDDDLSPYAASSYKGWSNAAFFGVPLSIGNPREVSLSEPVAHKVNGGGVTLKTEADLGFADLTSYTAGQWQSGTEATNELAAMIPPNGTPSSSPFVPLIVTTASWDWHESTYSQEFNLGRSGRGPVDWVAGLFYFYDDTTYSPFNLGLYGPVGPGGLTSGAPFPWPASSYVSTGPQPFSAFSTPTYSGAAFADVTYHVGKWHFTAGGRYSIDRAGERYTSYPQLANSFTTFYGSANHTFYEFTPRFVVRYSLTPDSNVYLSYSKGSKAGLFNSSGFLIQQTPLAPEKITDIEGGYKATGEKWRFEASGFHYKYTNLQVSTYIGGQAFLQNAPAAELWGFDAHWQQALTDHLQIDLGAAYTHARYQDFRNAAVQTFSPVFGVQNSTTDVSGGQMERAPKFMATAALSYSTPLAGGVLNYTANGAYQSDSSFDFANTLVQKGYTLINMRAAWTDPSKRWTVSLNGKNVLNKAYLVQVLPNAGGFGAVYGAPSSVTFQVEYGF
jgi:iron complex outermembrane receptor protein